MREFIGKALLRRVWRSLKRRGLDFELAYRCADEGTQGVGCFVGCSVDLTWPMAKLSTFWDYTFSREN